MTKTQSTGTYNDYLNSATWNLDAEDVMSEMANSLATQIEKHLFQQDIHVITDNWLSDNKSYITQQVIKMEQLIKPACEDEYDTAGLTVAHLLHLADHLQAMSRVLKEGAETYIDMKRDRTRVV